MSVFFYMYQIQICKTKSSHHHCFLLNCLFLELISQVNGEMINSLILRNYLEKLEKSKFKVSVAMVMTIEIAFF